MLKDRYRTQEEEEEEEKKKIKVLDQNPKSATR